MDTKRIVYKTPYDRFKQRLWLVKSVTKHADHWVVTHGIRGRRVTTLPLCEGHTMTTEIKRLKR